MWCTHRNNIKGHKMKNISLINVSMIVVAATLASSFVSADDQLTSQLNGQVEYAELIASLDSDNDGLLSQAEIITSKVKVLPDAFDKIDLNNDEKISEKEFNDFLVNINAKKVVVTKISS